MLSLQDDSSEEDEEIVIDTAVSSTLPPKPELSMSTHDPTSNEKILFAEEDEDDEEDAPLPETVDEQAPMAIDPSVIPKRQSEISNIYLDASESLANDAWDTEAWGIYIEEVEQGRGGTVTAIDAYTKFLAQFPRAMNVWKLLVDYYIDRSDFISAEQQFSKCLLKCRSVELWLSYLSMIKKKSIDRFTRDHGNDQEYLIERQSYENAIEKAIDNVGMAIDSYPLWRLYVDHVKDSKEMGNFDTGRKLLVLRKVYQRVLCVPIEGLSNFWKEYEALERSTGEVWAERVLPEYNEKYLHTRAIYKERKRFTSRIAFDRLATPSKQTVTELQQLDHWDKFELSNPDNLSQEAHHEMMCLVFERCICCFYHHPEVWIAFSSYLQKNPDKRSEARSLLKEAIEVSANVIFLRLALAELEEVVASTNNHSHTTGNASISSTDTARDVLRSAFECMPCAFTFGAYQRYVRRKDGMIAARKLFSETLPLRLEKKIGYDVYMAHAELELDVNCNPKVALRILELAKTVDPIGTSDVDFIWLLTRVLIRLGDLKQIRWVYELVLSDDHSTLGTSAVALTLSTARLGSYTGLAGLQASSTTSGDSSTLSVVTSGLTDTLQRPNIQATGKKKSLKEQLQLWENYLQAETILGLSDIIRLDELRACRDHVKSLVEALESAGHGGSDDTVESDSIRSKNIQGIFERSRDLCERYSSVSMNPNKSDLALRDRSRGKSFLHEVIRKEKEHQVFIKEAATTTKAASSAAKRLGDNVSADLEASLLGIPAVIRELLSKLPTNTSSTPLPDVESFVKQLKNIVLPPRPSPSEFAEQANVADKSLKRDRKDEENDDLDDDGEGLISLTQSRADDIFRKRQRDRLLM